MIQRLKNGNEYCDCFDWNEDSKELALPTMNKFNYLLHTVGVTKEQQMAYYISDPEYRESELSKELQQLVNI